MALFSFGFPSNKSFSSFGQYVEKDSAQSGTSHDACKVLGGHCCCRRLIKSLCLVFEATPLFGGFKGNHGNLKGTSTQLWGPNSLLAVLQYFKQLGCDGLPFPGVLSCEVEDQFVFCGLLSSPCQTSRESVSIKQ